MVSPLRNRFRGCLVGALLGDCLGERFEGFFPVRLESVIEYTQETIKRKPMGSVEYTDDSAMTRAICRSLLDQQGYDDSSMAYAFVDEFYQDMYRGYGAAVSTVFKKLRKARNENLKGFNVMTPATEQFEGKGSYGNGAAMRISPLALIAKDSCDLQQVRMIFISHQ